MEDLSKAMKRQEKNSNREEEEKNIIKAEDLQISDVATTIPSQDKLEEMADCQEFTRYFTLTLF